jgi:hypothetical protein
MNKEKSESPGSNDLNLLYIVVALILVAKFGPKAVQTYQNVKDYFAAHQLPGLNLKFPMLGASCVVLASYLWNRYQSNYSQRAVTGKDENSYLLGKDLKTGKDIYLREEFLATHGGVTAGTGEGKTVLLSNLQIQGINRGRGMIIIDGKADRSYRDQIYAHVVKAGRQNDFMMFSLSNPFVSSTFNPFCDGSPELIAERIFAATNLDENGYYESIQFAGLRNVLALLMRRGEKPIPGVVRELLRDQNKLKGWLTDLKDPELQSEIGAMLEQKREDFQKNYSGLVTALGHFSTGTTSKLFNVRNPEIQILDAIRRNKIVYFQLPTMQFPFLGEATGKLILQCIQSAVSQIQENGLVPKDLYMVYLDDFNDYIYPKFASLLNKARSANVGVIFSHQSIGDLKKVSPEFCEIVLSNTKFKTVMRVNDPDTAEHFSKMIGTRNTEKSTSRRSRGFFGSQDTGEESVRNTEEYIVHPNVFKQELKRGQGVVMIPYPYGRIVTTVEFCAAEWAQPISLPTHDLPELDLIKASTYQGKEKPNVKQTPPGTTELTNSANKDENQNQK